MVFLRYLCIYLSVFVLSPDLSANVVPVGIETEIFAENTVKLQKVKRNFKKKRKPYKTKEIQPLFLIFWPLYPLIGFLIVGIAAPLAIVWLWIIGLIILGLTSLVFIISIISDWFEIDILMVVGVMVAVLLHDGFTLLFSIVYAILGLIFLIWGLIAALPVLWISGIIGLLLTIFSMLFFFENT